MSRSDQYIGLNSRARTWLDENARKVTLITDFKVIDDEANLVKEHHHERLDNMHKTIGKIRGAWADDVAPLLSYPLKDGRVATEYIQAEPWSSGPMYFIALKVDGEPVPDSLWTANEFEAEGELPETLDQIEDQSKFLDSLEV